MKLIGFILCIVAIPPLAGWFGSNLYPNEESMFTSAEFVFAVWGAYVMGILLERWDAHLDKKYEKVEEK